MRRAGAVIGGVLVAACSLAPGSQIGTENLSGDEGGTGEPAASSSTAGDDGDDGGDDGDGDGADDDAPFTSGAPAEDEDQDSSDDGAVSASNGTTGDDGPPPDDGPDATTSDDGGPDPGTTDDGGPDPGTTDDGGPDPTGGGEGPYEYDGAMWYRANAFGDTCNAVCTDHGGLAAAAAVHTGDPVSAWFDPDVPYAGDWQGFECLTDVGTRWGATGVAVTGDESHPACRFYCPCQQ